MPSAKTVEAPWRLRLVVRKIARREKGSSLAKPLQRIFNALIGGVRQRIAANGIRGIELPLPPLFAVSLIGLYSLVLRYLPPK
jgi:hypothetical protein